MSFTTAINEVMSFTKKNTNDATFSNVTVSVNEEATTTNGETLNLQPNNFRTVLKENEIAYVMIGIFGILGNFLSIVVFLRSKKLLINIANHFLVNQSIIDLIASFFVLITTVVKKKSENLTGVAGILRCYYWNTSFPLWATFLSSTYNLVALTVERYLEICHPIRHKQFFDKTKAYGMMVCAWAVGLLFHAPRYAITSAVIDGKCFAMARNTTPISQKIYAVITFVVQFILPIAIHVFCYISMMRVFKNPNVPGKKNSENKIRARKNIFKTLLIVVVLFVACWIWNQVIFFFHNIDVKKVNFSGWNYHLSVITMFLNCCVNPVIYLIKYEEFQKSLSLLMCRNRIKPENISTATDK